MHTYTALGEEEIAAQLAAAIADFERQILGHEITRIANHGNDHEEARALVTAAAAQIAVCERAIENLRRALADRAASAPHD